ncbi:MAG: hypothetical protein WCE81_09650 [Halobacteriota archaeon]
MLRQELRHTKARFVEVFTAGSSRVRIKSSGKIGAGKQKLLITLRDVLKDDD